MGSVEDRKDNKKPENGFSIDKMIEFVKKNARYFAAGALFVILVVILAKYAGTNDKDGSVNGTEILTEAVTDTEPEQYQEDAMPEINELISDYYKAYQDGDVKKLKKYAHPISKHEQSYIKMFSEYVEKYQNLKCYTKQGLDDKSYLVSVYLEIKFKDVDTVAPGLDFFYVTTDDDGKLYIDNLYSQFNLLNQEQDLDKNVKELIDNFELEDDVLALQKDVQQRYEDAVKSDEKLAKLIQTTIADATSKWAQDILAEQATEQPATEQPATEEKKDDKSDEKKDEKKDDKSDKKKDEKKDDKSDKKKDDKSNEKKDEQQTTEQPATEQQAAEQPAAETPQPETVYATDTVNIRTQPNESADVIEKVSSGTSLTRTGTTEDGWSKLDYNGTEAYVKSDYVSTEAPAAPSVPEGTVVRVTESINIRSSMSETADKVGTAFSGEKLTVIMSYAEGWTKVNWNGKEGFVKTDLLK